MKQLKQIEILLVEDNPGDVRLTQEALKESKLHINLNVVYDGVEAMNFLNKLDKYKDYPTPDLIILDLNLPKKDGREVLEDIKKDEILKTIPIVVLTSSQADEDIKKSYKLHVNCYISKPVDMSQFIKVVKNIGKFWFSIVKLPPKE